MKVRELAFGLLWSASAVEVAQFTWQAYTSTFNSFPDTGSGPGSAGTIPGVSPEIYKSGTLFPGVFNAIRNAFGSGGKAGARATAEANRQLAARGGRR